MALIANKSLFVRRIVPGMSLIRDCRPGVHAERPLRERRKAVFTCPRCGRTEPFDGEWRWVDCERGTELCCPSCETVLTVREGVGHSDRSK
jgi:predicted RNA-binding Zn-ribbon protein involved in translation (DUF1610 family)